MTNKLIYTWLLILKEPLHWDSTSTLGNDRWHLDLYEVFLTTLSGFIKNGAASREWYFLKEFLAKQNFVLISFRLLT